MPAGTDVCVVNTLLDRAASKERRVAFVHVIHSGLDSEHVQNAHATDAQNDLLPDTRVDVAAVQRVRDIAVLRQRVVRNIGVEQVERNAAHLQPPNLNEDVASWQTHGDLQILAGGVFYRHHRKSVEVVGRIALLLPAVGIQQLAKVTLLIQKSHPDQWVPLVA